MKIDDSDQFIKIEPTDWEHFRGLVAELIVDGSTGRDIVSFIETMHPVGMWREANILLNSYLDIFKNLETIL